ncbi:MAG: proline dehydrogenase family protein [Flavobacteriales bacterium]
MISFENTAIAFESKTDEALNKAYYLFRLLGNNNLVRFSKPFAGVAMKIGFPFRMIVRHTIFDHFCGGESIDDCENTIQHLYKYGVKTILDYSVEGKETEQDFDRNLQEILATQVRASKDQLVPFNVFKITGIARFSLLEKLSTGQKLSPEEQKEYDRVKNRVIQICERSKLLKLRVMMDAEESWIQPILDELSLEMMKTYNHQYPLFYNTFQMYRHDRLKVLESLIVQAQKEGFQIGVKLVRGAYMEKERKRAADLGYPSPIQPDKESSDRDYNKALELIMEHIDRVGVCAGTHNEYSSAYLTELMSRKNVAKNHPNIYFSQLLGMSDHISFNLAHEGYNVAKYVPYGPVQDVLPYLIRRADENTSVAGQSSRELNLIKLERQRRRKK